MEERNMVRVERVVEEFQTLVEIDSPSFGEREMGDYLTKRLVELGLEVSEDEAGKVLGGNCGNIYGKLEGSLKGAPLLFCVHMDTVEPASGKKAVIGEDGVIQSAGDTVLGADDLSGVSAILEALQVIKEENLPHRPIEVLFTVAEEVYCRGAALVDYTRLKAKEAYVLDLTGPVGLAAYKAPTFLFFKIEVTGKAAHAGFAPEKGIHAIAAAAEGIGKVKLGRIDEDTTVNIGLIEGGLATNIVPEKCIVKGEIRSYSMEKSNIEMLNIEKIFRSAANSYGAEIEVSTERMASAYETPLEHPVVKRFEKACEENKLTSVLEETFGGSDNNHLSQHGITGIVIASAMNQCHSTKEFTTVEELEKIASLTLSLMILTD
jgi:tripeptide aminopeptidase